MSIQDRIAAKKAAKAAGTLTPEPPPAAAAPAKKPGGRAARFGSSSPEDAANPDAQEPAPLQSAPNATNATENATLAQPSADHSDSTTAPSTDPTPVKTGRAARFNRAGSDDDLPPELRDEPASAATNATEHATNRPNQPTSRAERFRNSGALIAARRQALDEQREQEASAASSSSQKAEPIAWEDESRPAGSEHSLEEWAQAEADNPQCVIVELVKLDERALMAIPKNGINDMLLHRSLVIDSRVDSPWKANSTAKIEHHGEFGVSNYLVVRCEEQRRKFPLTDGSLMVLRDEGAAEKEAKHRSRADRFR